MTIPVSQTLERVLDHLSEMRNGKFDLRWMHANPDGWGTRAKPSALGLTLDDINVGKYGEIPVRGGTHGSMAPRGCEVPPETPSLGTYDVDDRGTVWADNCGELYEEAVARQWSSARDIPWDRLQELPEDIERAVCQLCTGLTEVEFIAGDLPAKWLWRINHDFHEVKLFLASQVFDEARHMDVFRKRALANGGGLLQASPGSESVLRIILDAPNYTVASSLMHILAEGFVLTLFRHGEFLAPTEVEKKIFRLCMQDEARHVGYGTMHLKRFLQEHPERAEEVHRILDVGEEAMLALSLEPQGIEPRLILAGGGVDRMQEGMMRTAFLFQKQVREYLHRLHVAGLERGDRCKLPLELPQ
ncbi:MAG TPA: ferritin-like domain-containing protein [Candidatus Eisenbacteria bacterium]|nr:ferritin-like domain-containing protein [Candidatus Eisenbacteria bacterium]